MSRKSLDVVSFEWPPEIGGVARYAPNLVSAIRRVAPELDVRVLTLNSRREGTPGISAPVDDVEVVRLPGALPLQKRRWGVVGRALIDRLLDRRADAILAVDSLGQLFVNGARRFVDCRYGVVACGTEVNAFRERPLLRLLSLGLYKRADVVVSISAYTAGLLGRRWVVTGEKIVIVYPQVSALPVRGDRGEVRRSLEIPDEAFVIVQVARLDERKGHRHVIDSLVELTSASDVYFLVIGGGPVDELKCHAKSRGVEDRVRFVGALIDEEVGGCLRASDLFVLAGRQVASRVEGFGIVLAEAGLAGLPALAVNTGAVNEVIRDNDTGILIPEPAPKLLAQKITDFRRDPQMGRDMGARAREYIHERFGEGAQDSAVRQMLDRLLPPGISSCSEDGCG